MLQGDGRRHREGLTARQNFRSDITSCRCPTNTSDSTDGQKFKLTTISVKKHRNTSSLVKFPTTTVTMPREAEPSLNERTFISQALAEGFRTDNRKLDQCRPVQLDLGDEFGVADVKFGKTR